MTRGNKASTDPAQEKEEEKKTESVSREEFVSLKEEIGSNFKGIGSILEELLAKSTAADPKAAAEEKRVLEASPTMLDVNPRYDALAKEILGDRLLRTYVAYPKGGGTLFTIVINPEFSNAPKDYLERYKEDHRTVNIEREEFRGEDGVTKWAKLILANLGRKLR